MKDSLFVFLLILLLGCHHKKKNEKPNIIYFLADDLGYGEVGVYGQKKIKTPYIDALAKSGMLFTQHYSGAPVCAPARSVLLTGLHAGHTPIRGNDEWTERGDVWNPIKVENDASLEGQRPIPENTVTLAKLLKKAGYTTGIFGKWGLGAPKTVGTPLRQGFDYFYGYNCQRQAHTLYPKHLWENDKKVILNNKLMPWHTKLDASTNPNEAKGYKQYIQNDYAPELIHDKALSFINKNKDNPFFLYYASPLPHLPLQIPTKFTEEYHKIFGDEKPYIGGQGYYPNQYPRATYAAMITYLDAQLGELIKTLKALDLYDNTIIIFSSDNGNTYNGGADYDFFNSSSPFSNGYGRTKGFVYEGGIRVPMIASWSGKIKPNTKSNHISAFYDVLPTLCDIVGIKTPTSVDGISFKPTLFGKQQQKHEYLYWEFPAYGGQQAVRMDNWKAIRKNIVEGNMKIELFNLDNDQLEQNNVAEHYPEIINKIEKALKYEHVTSTNKNFQLKALEN